MASGLSVRGLAGKIVIPRHDESALLRSSTAGAALLMVFIMTAGFLCAHNVLGVRHLTAGCYIMRDKCAALSYLNINDSPVHLRNNVDLCYRSCRSSGLQGRCYMTGQSNGFESQGSWREGWEDCWGWGGVGWVLCLPDKDMIAPESCSGILRSSCSL